MTCFRSYISSKDPRKANQRPTGEHCKAGFGDPSNIFKWHYRLQPIILEFILALQPSTMSDEHISNYLSDFLRGSDDIPSPSKERPGFSRLYRDVSDLIDHEVTHGRPQISRESPWVRLDADSLPIPTQDQSQQVESAGDRSRELSSSVLLTRIDGSSAATSSRNDLTITP